MFPQDDTESSFYIPAVFKRDPNAALSASASPLEKLDTLTAEVMESRNVLRCSDAEGDLYVQSGVGGLRDTGEGVLWSAMCCAVLHGPGSFSMGVVQDKNDHKNLNIMSIEELEELVGIEELFAGGCENSQQTTDDGDDDKDVADLEEEKETVDTKETETLEEKTQKIIESGPEEGANNTESVLLNVLSTSISLVFSPIISTLTNFPYQVGFVLQEDAAVLASLPVDSARLVGNLGSGVVKTVENVGSVGYQVTKHSACSLFDFISIISGTLLNSCYEGLAGTGTLTCDILGLVTDTLMQVFDFGTGVGGTAGRRLGGFVGTVGSEMGDQGLSVGRGVGTLIWRGVRGVGHVLNGVLSIVGGVMGNTVENVKDAFEKE